MIIYEFLRLIFLLLKSVNYKKLYRLKDKNSWNSYLKIITNKTLNYNMKKLQLI